MLRLIAFRNTVGWAAAAAAATIGGMLWLRNFIDQNTCCHGTITNWLLGVWSDELVIHVTQLEVSQGAWACRVDATLCAGVWEC